MKEIIKKLQETKQELENFLPHALVTTDEEQALTVCILNLGYAVRELLTTNTKKIFLTKCEAMLLVGVLDLGLERIEELNSKPLTRVNIAPDYEEVLTEIVKRIDTGEEK